jgi:hypothetical protein
MKKIFAAILLALPILGLVLFLLVQRDPTVYASERVKVLGVGLNEDGLRLRFQPPSEVGYYCPGVRFRRDGSAIHYEYVRTRVDNKVPVDAAAQTDRRGDLYVMFPYDRGKWDAGDHVELIDSTGRPIGKFKRLDEPRSEVHQARQ